MNGVCRMVKTMLYCPICQNNVWIDEKVNLDILNTITHKNCNSRRWRYRYPIKDSGTFGAIIVKYTYFDSVLDY